MKKVLIISPQFAPVNSADSHRVRQMLPYLKDNGWYAEIVAVKIDCLEKPVLDNLLLDTIPNNTVVHYVGAFDSQWTRKIGLGSLSLRSFYHYYRFLNSILKKQSFDLIFFSTTSFHLLALGTIMKRKFKIPFVLDIQDPWRSDFYLDKPKNQRPPKFLMNYYLDKFLEAYTIPNADGIISVSNEYIRNFNKRYSVVSKNQMVIPFSATIFDHQNTQLTSFESVKNTAYTRIVYVGRGGHDLGFAVKAFLQAIKIYTSQPIDSAKQFKLSFIGTSYAAKGKGSKTIEPIANEIGLNNIVLEKTDRVSYFEAIDLLQSADILFIPGSTDSGYTASKIYPYILADKPIIACFHENSSVVNILKDCSKSRVVTFNSETKESQVVDTLYKELEFIMTNYEDVDWRHDHLIMQKYMAPAMTKKIIQVFESVIVG